MSKKTVILLGVGFVVSLVLTIVLYIRMGNQNLEYEEVEVQVVNTYTENYRVRGQYSSSTTTKYVVEVWYGGDIYELGNVHGLAGYSEGRTVKAYLSNGKLYANVEGVNTSTPLAYAYFGFLFASFILLIVFLSNLPKLFKK